MKYVGDIPGGEYGCIVADPPWETKIGGVFRKYPYGIMTLQELYLMEPMIYDRTTTDAHLWLWTTNPLLLDGTALSLCKVWGFEPRGLLTWDKELVGLGWWLRGRTEHCIWATRRQKRLHKSAVLSTLIREKRTRHSRKPEAFWQYPESLSPAPRLDLFATSRRTGWTSMVYAGDNVWAIKSRQSQAL